MPKIPRDDPRVDHMAGDQRVNRDELFEIVRTRHHWVLATSRRDGRPQLSPVTGELTQSGLLAVATYPERAKARNAARHPESSVMVMGDSYSDEWIQIGGEARVVNMPEALDELIEYYRCISGEHPNWDEYRAAMIEQGKCVILIEPVRWGPVSRGGFPPSLFEDPADQDRQN